MGDQEQRFYCREAYLEIQVCYPASVKVLQSLQRFPDEERHLLLHQLVMGGQVIQQTSVLQSDTSRNSIKKSNCQTVWIQISVDLSVYFHKAFELQSVRHSKAGLSITGAC